jgi:hypothetical protein
MSERNKNPYVCLMVTDPFIDGLRAFLAQNPDIKPARLSRQAGLDVSAVRKMLDGSSKTPKLANAEKIAAALGQTVDQITALAGATASDAAARVVPLFPLRTAPGFSEATLAEYKFQEQPIPENEPRPALRRIFGTAGRTLAEHWLTDAIPAFHLLAGDVIVVDLALTPKPGQLCIASRLTGPRDQALIVARFWGDWIDLGDTSLNGAPIRTDAPGITARNPIIGVLRGLPPPAKEKP